MGSRFARVARIAVLSALCLAPAAAAPAEAGRLSDAVSTYLRMHAEDSIDWHPWGAEALALARHEDKLIFVSLGASSCHWCHVMARETFADPSVARELNAHFVSILVDRDARPDLEAHFMEIMQAATGRSLVPANFILTPDLRPLFAAGYLSPEPVYGQPGFLAVLDQVIGVWSDDRETRRQDAETRDGARQDARAALPIGDAKGRTDPRDRARDSWSRDFDYLHGGFGQGPKFLLPNVLSFLLRQGVRLDDEALLERVYGTLDAMAAGGARDQLGGAFHRGTLDRAWRVPRFEILLDLNAALARLYLEAYQVSGKPRYAGVARQILDDLLARLRLPDGSFASALDSESDGQMGLYYSWTVDELRAALAPDSADAFLEAYLDSGSDLILGRSILRLSTGVDSWVRMEGLLKNVRPRLLEARAGRAPPRRDETRLTAWNALAVGAFAKAAQVLDEGRYLLAAQKAMARLLAAAPDLHGLSRSHFGKRRETAVFLDDYAYLAQALLELYETDFRIERLDAARELMEIVFARFQERPGAPFQLAPLGTSEGIPSRIVLDEDGLPSGNAVALAVLQRLRLYGAEAAFGPPSEAILRNLGRYLETRASSATGLLAAFDFDPAEAHQVVIVGGIAERATSALLREVYRRPLRGTVLALVPPDAPRKNEAWPLLAGRPMLDGRPTAYLCRRGLCGAPLATPERLAAQLDKILAGDSPLPAPYVPKPQDRSAPDGADP